MEGKTERERLGEILIRHGHIEHAQLELALAEQQGTNRLLGQILLAHKFCTFEQLVAALEEQGAHLLD